MSGARVLRRVPFWEILNWKRVPPSPPIYWNHGLSGTTQFDLWGTITCGQNLDFRELAPLAAEALMPLAPWQSSAFSILGARTDVTTSTLILWKFATNRNAVGELKALVKRPLFIINRSSQHITNVDSPLRHTHRDDRFVSECSRCAARTQNS